MRTRRADSPRRPGQLRATYGTAEKRLMARDDWAARRKHLECIGAYGPI